MIYCTVRCALWVFLWCERLFLLANMFWHTSQDVSFGIFKYHHPSRAVISFDCLELLQLATFPFTCKQLDEELQFIWVHIPRGGEGAWSFTNFTIMVFSAALPANAEQHLCGEQQHDCLPRSCGYSLSTSSPPASGKAWLLMMMGVVMLLIFYWSVNLNLVDANDEELFSLFLLIFSLS